MPPVRNGGSLIISQEFRGISMNLVGVFLTARYLFCFVINFKLATYFFFFLSFFFFSPLPYFVSMQLSAEHNILWQGEMERGFSKMMRAMEVYLKDGDGWEDLKANTKNYAP